MSSTLPQRFASAAEKQIEGDAQWLRTKGWSRRTCRRMADERRERLAGWQDLSPRDGAKLLLRALAEPRARRIGR